MVKGTYSTDKGYAVYKTASALLSDGDKNEGYRLLIEASELGCEDADRMLGLAFVQRNGNGMQYMTDAVARQDADACAAILRLYDRGFPGISAEVAENCCRIAADHGNRTMKERLLRGFCQDPCEEQLLRRIDAGDTDALFQMWQLCLAQNREEDFHVYFAKAVEAGQIDTLIQAARWSGDPDYQSFDPELSHEFYLLAADKGNTEAMIALGDDEVLHSDRFFFEESSTDPVIREEHVKQFGWYLKAAKAGDPLAMFHVGCAYEHGYPVNSDMSEAFRWFSSGAMIGDRECALRAAVCCENGFGTDENAAKAAEYRNLVKR